MALGYLNSKHKEACLGCESCAQVCSHSAIHMVADEEGFRYPKIDAARCVDCGLCHSTCPIESAPMRYQEDVIVFGGHHISDEVVLKSTSGGAFSAIIEGWCDANYIIFGATGDGLHVYHDYITDKKEISRFRKSKYTQSEIGNSYQQVKSFLRRGEKVLFSGTPCQIAGLMAFLGDCDKTNLLTIEVICEGVPSPLLINKMCTYYDTTSGVDYRYKNKRGCWDFQMMKLWGNNRTKTIDRWFNPFWSIWLQHLVSRPSCYECPFASSSRVADLTLGDLWGVHLYCPDLYNDNHGASLVLCNNAKGREALSKALPYLVGRFLQYKDAVKYQSPLRKPIAYNEGRLACMADLQNEDISFQELAAKYAVKPSAKLLVHKYLWGNRQKVRLWKLLKRK